MSESSKKPSSTGPRKGKNKSMPPKKNRTPKGGKPKNTRESHSGSQNSQSKPRFGSDQSRRNKTKSDSEAGSKTNVRIGANDGERSSVSEPIKDVSKVQFVTITEENHDQRIDNFLISFLKGVPKTLVYRIIRKGEVRVNKGRIKQTTRLNEGDVVRIPPVKTGEEKKLVKASKELTDFLERALIYEDDDLMVVNKPSGMAVHGGSGINLGLIETVRQMRPKAKMLELVHRLDRDTSGCILIAKKRTVLVALHDALKKKRGIEKIYHALVVGKWPKHMDEVNAPLKKNELKSGERIVKVDGDGKASLTRFKILNHFKDYSLVQASPITGRTHQIRVHTQFTGHPIAGDQKYCTEEQLSEIKSIGLKRLFLHAAKLSFKHPKTEEWVSFEAEYDAAMNKAIKQLKSEFK